MLVAGAGLPAGGAGGFSEVDAALSELGFERACDLMELVASRLGTGP
jgi:hypothetical protein